MKCEIGFFLGIFFSASILYSQPVIKSGVDDAELRAFFEKDSSIIIKRIKYKGAKRALGVFEDEDSIFNMRSGLVLSSGSVKKISRPNKSASTSSFNWRKGNRLLNAISSEKTKDAATIEITFVPTQAYVSFNYVFGSDEYPEFALSPYNDAFALFLRSNLGKTYNLALIPYSDDRISVNSVNYAENPAYYVNNCPLKLSVESVTAKDTTYFWKGKSKYAVYRTYNISAAIVDDPKIPVEFDGFTKLLQAKSKVKPGKTYKLTISVADAGDRIYDSGVLIEKGSFTANKSRDYKFGALAIDTNYYFKSDTVLIYSPPKPTIKAAPKIETPCEDTLIHIYYRTNEFQLIEAEITALKKLIMSLDSTHQYQVYIQSYTDEVGKGNDNYLLSQQRSRSVASYLKANYFPNIELVRTQANGVDNDSEKSLSEKRRTTVFFKCT